MSANAHAVRRPVIAPTTVSATGRARVRGHENLLGSDYHC